MRGHTRRTTSDPTTGEVSTHVGWFAALPWIWPMVTAMAVLPVGYVIHRLWGSSDKPWVGMLAAVVILASMASMTGLTWLATEARGPLVHRGSTAAVASVGVWLIAALIAGIQPATASVWGLLFLGSFGFLIVKAGRSGNGAGADPLAKALKQDGVRALSARRDGDEVHGVLEVPPGVPGAEVARRTENLASYAGTGPGSVRMHVDPDSARRIPFSIMTEDKLRTPIPYPGPSRPGASIMEPIILGRREDGAIMQIHLPGCERTGRPGCHVGISGMTNAGKSSCARCMLVEIGSRYDTEIDIIDVAKGAQFVGPFRGRVRSISTRPAEANALMASLPEEITYRSEHLGDRDLDAWTQGCGLPLRVVFVDELAALLRGGDKDMICRVAETGRSVGVHLILATQRWVHPTIPTDLRNAMGTFLAFGCRDGDQEHGISSAAIDAGATPHRWGSSRPGYVYLEASTLTETDWAMRNRTWHAQPAQIRAAIAAHFPPADADPVAETLVPPRSPATPPPGLALVATPPAPSEQLRDHLQDLIAAGKTEVRPADFASIKDRHDLSPAWVTKELAKLVDQEKLRSTDSRGVYEVVGGVAS